MSDEKTGCLGYRCLGYIGDEILPRHVGIAINKPLQGFLLNNQDSIDSKSSFYSWFKYVSLSPIHGEMLQID